MPTIQLSRSPQMTPQRRSLVYMKSMRGPPVPNSIEANQKDYGVRPSAMVITPSQRGSQP